MAEDQPTVRVVRGHPTAEQLAALVPVLLRAGPTPGGEPDSSDWLASARPGAVVAGRPATPGPTGWRRSGLPR